jgi:hypothetical protein
VAGGVTGVYRTFTGVVPRLSMLWAVVLRAGRGAALSHQTAAELAALVDEPASVIHVTVPGSRRVRPMRGVVIHCSSHVGLAVHPGLDLPRTRIEETVVDLTQTARGPDEAIGWITGACSRRLTTPDRILAVLRGRKKLRWRRLLSAVVDDTAAGCHSVLERWYLRDVERAHALPKGRRQALRQVGKARRYEDVRYDDYRATVELDGRAPHPDDRRWLDQRRDNEAAAAGDRVLRFGWRDVCHPCVPALQTARALRAGGWRGRPKRCRRPDCVIPKTFGGNNRKNSSGS